MKNLILIIRRNIAIISWSTIVIVASFIIGVSVGHMRQHQQETHAIYRQPCFIDAKLFDCQEKEVGYFKSEIKEKDEQ